MKVLLIFAVSYCCISALMAQDPVKPTTTVPTTVTTTTTASTTTTTASTTTTTASTTTTTASTTTTTASTTTTTPIPSDPVEYCKGKGVGRYTWPRDDTCKTYVYCFVQSSTGSLTGAIYTCAGTTTFNPTLQLCDTSKAVCK